MPNYDYARMYGSASQREQDHAFAQLVPINIILQLGVSSILARPLFITVEHHGYPLLIEWIRFDPACALGEEGMDV